jgi:hypothetical protein
MANDIANHLFVYGSRNDVDWFFATFIREGLAGHVPIRPDAVPSADPATKHRGKWEQINSDHWGVLWGPRDIYWRYDDAHGVSLLDPESKTDDNLSHFGECEPPAAMLPTFVQSSFQRDRASTPPGYEPPHSDHAVLYLKFYTPWCPPSEWFGRVATDVFPRLRLYMESYDLANIEREYPVFWSVAGESKFYQSGYWAACVVAPLPEPDGTDEAGKGDPSETTPKTQAAFSTEVEHE